MISILPFPCLPNLSKYTTEPYGSRSLLRIGFHKAIMTFTLIQPSPLYHHPSRDHDYYRPTSLLFEQNSNLLLVTNSLLVLSFFLLRRRNRREQQQLPWSRSTIVYFYVVPSEIRRLRWPVGFIHQLLRDTYGLGISAENI